MIMQNLVAYVGRRNRRTGGGVVVREDIPEVSRQRPLDIKGHWTGVRLGSSQLKT